jgi:hypothetical protein
MKITLNELRKIIKKSLNEIKYSEFSDIKYSNNASSHDLYTGSRNNKNFYIKFPAGMLQTLVEYLAYRIYELYAEKNPDYVVQPDEIYLVINNNTVGIATSEGEGRDLSGRSIINFYGKEIYDAFARHVGSRYYIDALMANWDQSKNVLIAIKQNENGENTFAKSTAFDPGGSLTFRAQGAKKGSRFGYDVGELETFLDPAIPGMNSYIYPYRDEEVAKKIFMSVSIDEIMNRINQVCAEVCEELNNNNFSSLCAEFKAECAEISDKLYNRHIYIMNKIS